MQELTRKNFTCRNIQYLKSLRLSKEASILCLCLVWISIVAFLFLVCGLLIFVVIYVFWSNDLTATILRLLVECFTKYCMVNEAIRHFRALRRIPGGTKVLYNEGNCGDPLSLYLRSLCLDGEFSPFCLLLWHNTSSPSVFCAKKNLLYLPSIIIGVFALLWTFSTFLSR
jgi:hypothetical protein